VIERDRGAVTMWLASMVPQRWSDKDKAIRFASRGDARRAAVQIKLSGDWAIEPAGGSGE